MNKKLKSRVKLVYPVSIPSITRKDANNVSRVIRDGWISSDGPEIKKFEENFSRFIRRKYSVAVSSGTAALEIAIKAAGIKKNDEVLIPNFTIISNALSVIRQQAKPIPIDCNLNDWNIKIEDIEKNISKKTKAIIITHIYSFPNDMDKILKICKKHNLIIIEDAAEVLGIKYKQKMCGSFGDISTFSFYANKQLTTGEGGMISIDSLEIYEKCKSLRNLCFGKLNRFDHEDIGWNYRMTNMQAALGLGQLKNIKRVVKKKMEIGSYYYNELHKNPNIQILPPSTIFSKNIYWVVGIVIKNSKMKGHVLSKKLKKYGIQTRPFFWPMHEQKIFKKMKIFKKKKFPNSSYIAKYGIYLPSYFQLKKKDINYISSVVNKIIK
tara:strand:+ start:131 stop:1270 length:1140 start_codon:yes stop_codon:yes gene_type:complete